MEKQPLISVIIPVYNHAEALRASLASLERQTWKNWEAIVVDDGSAEPIFNFQFSIFNKPNATLITQENAGAPAARNCGFRESKGEYVIFWDADVIGEPEMLEQLYLALEDHSEASYAYADMLFGWKKMPARVFDAEALKKCNYIHSTSLIRREAVIDWDESLKKFQDWDYWLTLLAQGKIGVHVPAYLHKAQVGGRVGISSWLPSFAYRAPFKWLPGVAGKVRRYEMGKRVIMEKHGL